MLIISACTLKGDLSMPTEKIREVTFVTEDKVAIAATYYEAVSEKGVILIHMLGNNRQSWKEVAEILQKNEYQVLTIDLRGHGQSLQKNNQRISYVNFHEQDFLDMVKDIQAAKNFLEKQGISEITIIGASIGANLALITAAHDPDITRIVALSPGLNYKGIKPQEDSKKISVPVMLVAAEDDAYSAMSVRTLDMVIRAQKEVKIFPKADHGTRMIQQQPSLKGDILKFLQNY